MATDIVEWLVRAYGTEGSPASCRELLTLITWQLEISKEVDAIRAEDLRLDALEVEARLQRQRLADIEKEIADRRRALAERQEHAAIEKEHFNLAIENATKQSIRRGLAIHENNAETFRFNQEVNHDDN
jgi:hypothetical protein